MPAHLGAALLGAALRSVSMGAATGFSPAREDIVIFDVTSCFVPSNLTLSTLRRCHRECVFRLRSEPKQSRALRAEDQKQQSVSARACLSMFIYIRSRRLFVSTEIARIL